jgi:hypothetical protein
VELIGPYLVACTLLVGAGAAKAVRPHDTARALRLLGPIGLPAMVVAVRSGAVVEMAVGGVGLALPQRGPALAVAVSYAGFAVFVLVARVRGGAVASCGCFGTPDTPATTLHVVVDLILAGAAAAVAVAGQGGTLASVLAGQPAHGVPLLLVSALATWLTYLALSGLADLQAARRLTGVSFDRAGTTR